MDITGKTERETAERQMLALEVLALRAAWKTARYERLEYHDAWRRNADNEHARKMRDYAKRRMSRIEEAIAEVSDQMVDRHVE